MQRKKGHFSGKAPIGYRKVNKELVIDDIESEVVKDIFKSYLNGSSVCAITKELNDKNALNRHNVLSDMSDNTFCLRSK